MQHIAVFASLRTLLLASLMVVALAVAVRSHNASGSEATGAATPNVWGDVTCDSDVDLEDVSDLMRRSSGLGTDGGCDDSLMTLRLSPARAEAAAAGSIIVTITSEVHDPTLGFAYGSFDLNYDDTVMTPIACTSNVIACNLTFAPDVVRFALVTGTPSGLQGTRELARVEFIVGSLTAQTTDVTLSSLALGDNHGETLEASTTEAEISVLPLGESPAPTPPPSGSQFYYADINCDGKTAVTDALTLLEWVIFDEARSPAAVGCPAIGG